MIELWNKGQTHRMQNVKSVERIQRGTKTSAINNTEVELKRQREEKCGNLPLAVRWLENEKDKIFGGIRYRLSIKLNTFELDIIYLSTNSIKHSPKFYLTIKLSKMPKQLSVPILNKKRSFFVNQTEISKNAIVKQARYQYLRKIHQVKQAGNVSSRSLSKSRKLRNSREQICKTQEKEQPINLQRQQKSSRKIKFYHLEQDQKLGISRKNNNYINKQVSRGRQAEKKEEQQQEKQKNHQFIQLINYLNEKDKANDQKEKQREKKEQERERKQRQKEKEREKQRQQRQKMHQAMFNFIQIKTQQSKKAIQLLNDMKKKIDLNYLTQKRPIRDRKTRNIPKGSQEDQESMNQPEISTQITQKLKKWKIFQELQQFEGIVEDGQQTTLEQLRDFTVYLNRDFTNKYLKQKIMTDDIQVKMSKNLLYFYFSLKQLNQKQTNNYKQKKDNFKQTIEKFNKILLNVSKYLWLHYPRNKKTLIDEELNMTIVSFNNDDRIENDLMAMTGTVFDYDIHNEEFANAKILDQIKNFINTMIKKMKKFYPIFKKILNQDLIKACGGPLQKKTNEKDQKDTTNEKDQEKLKRLEQIMKNSHKFKIGSKLPLEVSEIKQFGNEMMKFDSNALFRIFIKWMEDLVKWETKPEQMLEKKKYFKKVFQKDKGDPHPQKDQKGEQTQEEEEQSKYQFNGYRFNYTGAQLGTLVESLKSIKNFEGGSKQQKEQSSQLVDLYTQLLTMLFKDNKQAQQSDEKVVKRKERQVYLFSKVSYEIVQRLVVQELVRLIRKLVKFRKIYDKDRPQQLLFVDLISFPVLDMLRGRIIVDMDSLLLIFEGLKKMEGEKKIQIVKVNNRLHQNLNDVLIIIKIKEETQSKENDFMLCQFQMILVREDGNLSELEKVQQGLNHFFYELERAPYKPLSELSLILKSKDDKQQVIQIEKKQMTKGNQINDEKIRCYCLENKQFINQNEMQKQKLELFFNHKVLSAEKVTSVNETKLVLKREYKQIEKFLPGLFLCGSCQQLYQKGENPFPVIECSSCEFTLCSACQFELNQQKRQKIYLQIIKLIANKSENIQYQFNNLDPSDSQRRHKHDWSSNKFAISVEKKMISYSKGKPQKQFWKDIKTRFLEMSQGKPKTMKVQKDRREQIQMKVEFYGLLIHTTQLFEEEGVVADLYSYTPLQNKLRKVNKQSQSEFREELISLRPLDTFCFLSDPKEEKNYSRTFSDQIKTLNAWCKEIQNNELLCGGSEGKQKRNAFEAVKNIQRTRGQLNLYGLNLDELDSVLGENEWNKRGEEPLFKLDNIKQPLFKLYFTQPGTKQLIDNIKFLNVSSNKIKSLQLVFERVKSLVQLRADNNEIRNLKVQGAECLTTISFNNNLIEKLNIEICPTIRYVFGLQNNYQYIQIHSRNEISELLLGSKKINEQGIEIDFFANNQIQNDHKGILQSLKILVLDRINCQCQEIKIKQNSKQTLFLFSVLNLLKLKLNKIHSQNTQFLTNMKKLQQLSLFNNKKIKKLDIPEGLNSLQQLTVQGNQNLKQLQLPTEMNSLQQLTVNYNVNLTQLQLPTEMNSLQKLSLSHTPLQKIQLSSVGTSLKELQIYSNLRLTLINLSTNLSHISYLMISGNPMLTLSDLQFNSQRFPHLQKVVLALNQLTTLPVIDLPLKVLDISYNPINSIQQELLNLFKRSPKLTSSLETLWIGVKENKKQIVKDTLAKVNLSSEFKYRFQCLYQQTDYDQQYNKKLKGQENQSQSEQVYEYQSQGESN